MQPPRLSTTVAGYPAVAWGTGDPLLVVPGLNDPLCRVGEQHWFDAAALAFCRRLARACASAGVPRRVFYVSRPAGLPTDATTRSMADGYRAVLDELGTVDLVGISMGGFIAGHLARDDRVRTCTYALAGDRLSRHGRRSIAQWRDWASVGDWHAIYDRGVRAVTRGPLSTLGRLVARGYDLVTAPRAPRDFRVSARACLDHEPASPECPTLVVGGTRDPFFTDEAFAATADRLDATHTRLDGWGHDAVVHAAGRFDTAVTAFLTD
ncbi:alpha/beta fold hydrolase [Natronomonas sp. EA1]|uniref:alpha/beta fold hydrolase n=1 Tax=Natronomonas sp. EA1 TaxID=3421655 RepID=UPI003EB7C9FD